MNLYTEISYYPRSRGSSVGSPMPLAQFMALGNQYIPQITAYREHKQQIATLKRYLSQLTDRLQQQQAILDLGINPLDPEAATTYALTQQEHTADLAAQEAAQQQLKQLTAEADSQKRNLPAATISGLFSPKRTEANLVHHSGFICIDIDDHFNRRNSQGQNITFPQSLDHVIDILTQLPWVLYASRSVGGSGYFALIPLGPVDIVPVTPRNSPFKGDQEGLPTVPEGSPEGVGTPPPPLKTHKWYFECLEEEFREYGLIIDPACSDVTRLRIISYDPNPYRNAHAVPYMGRHGFIGREERQRIADRERRAAEAAAYRARLNKTDSDILRDVEACVQQIEAQALDITQDYLLTIKIGMSLYNLGDSGLYLWKRICQYRSADHAHLRTDADLEQRWRTFGTGKSVPVEWFFKYLIDTDPRKPNGHPSWAIYAHPRRT